MTVRVVGVDAALDLALLLVPAPVQGTPLNFAQTEPLPGSTVFAVGNPMGLERTISQGLFSGYRYFDRKSSPWPVWANA